MSAVTDDMQVGEWAPPMAVFLCPPPSHEEPDVCDCGHEGAWEWRSVWGWHEESGHRRKDRTIRRDIARGFPSRTHDEGWWVIAGRDERCPQCGDIERFDTEGNRVAEFVQNAQVVSLASRRPQW
jgi:hypothetical protein